MDILYCPWCGENLRLGMQLAEMRCATPLPPIRQAVEEVEIVPNGTLTAQTIREFEESIIE